MVKEYTALFELWDVTEGEDRGELVENGELFTFAPLSKIEQIWLDYTEQCPVELSPLKSGAARVAMSRNGGEGIVRRRFEYEDKKYLITVRASTSKNTWRVNLPPGAVDFVEIESNDKPKVRARIHGLGWDTPVVEKKT